jgi:RHS repeat-associated protein
MLSPRRTGRGRLAPLVARVLIVALVLGLLPAAAQASLPSPSAPAAAPASDPALSLPALPSLAESVAPVLLAVVVALTGDGKPAPCAVVFLLADPHLPSKYHRARWVDPRVGRFTGMDPFGGVGTDPASLHKYTYAHGDPANKVDPTGQFTLVEAGILAAVIAVLAGAYLHSYPASQNIFGSGSRIYVVSFEWQNEFTLGGGRFTAEEVELVKLWTYQTMRLAYSGYRVLVSEGGRGTNRMIVKRGGAYNDYAGSTILGSIASEINYDLLADRALNYAPNKQDRREIAAGIGRGVGATAAHEFGHQVGLRWMDTTRDPNTYDFHSSDRFSQYYGQLHWLPQNLAELQKKVSY